MPSADIPQAALTQRQDSLTDQMRDVLRWAVENGCYDAHQWITDRWSGHLGDIARAQRAIDRENRRAR